jgi:5-methylcytosine-specific restriction enzyme subunit McrC
LRKTITKYEYDRLSVGENGFSERHFNALVKYNEKNGDKFFVVQNKKITFKQYVGMLQVGNLTIQILPKADKNIESKEYEKSRWYDALIKMLEMCRYIKLKSMTNANLRLRSASLFELYIDSFLNEVEALMRQGLQKKYRTIKQNVKMFKGKLSLNEHIRHNIAHAERFYNEFDIYDYDNKFNQILFRALKILQNFNVGEQLKTRVLKINANFPEITEKEITSRDFISIRHNRTTKRYEMALRLAKLIILHYSPDITTGSENVLAILFDMNKLFEEFVCRLLKKFNGGYYDIKAQPSTDFWRSKDNDILKTIRPDLIISKGDKSIVIDTKWKIPDGNCPADEDLRQMYVYNDRLKIKNCILLYPEMINEIAQDGTYEKKDFNCHMRGCELLFENSRFSLKNTYIELDKVISEYLPKT